MVVFLLIAVFLFVDDGLGMAVSGLAACFLWVAQLTVLESMIFS